MCVLTLLCMCLPGQGNIQLQKASEAMVSSRIFMLVFLLVASFVLLFLHWSVCVGWWWWGGRYRRTMLSVQGKMHAYERYERVSIS